MNSGNACILGAEIKSILWKIGDDPWDGGYVAPYQQGDIATALLKVELEDCGNFEGITLEAFVQVPNQAKDIVKVFATVDSDNKAIITLPTELLWYPGDYNVQFMFTDGDKVNYSNVLNAAYTVNENPALAGQNPPTILPGDKADYEDLISRLNAETTKAEAQIPQLDTLVAQAKDLHPKLNDSVTEANTKLTDMTDKIAEGNAAETKWQNTIDTGEAKIGELDVKIQLTDQKIDEADLKIDDVDNRIIQAEQEITDMEVRVAAGVKQIDDAVSKLPDEIKKIEDKANEGLTNLDDKENAGLNNLQAQEQTSKKVLTDQEALSKQNIVTQEQTSVATVGTKGDVEVLRVQNTGTKEVDEVTTEGTKQVGLVRAQGDTSLAAVVAVEDEIKQILVDNPGSLNALSLSGKTRVEFDNEIQANKEQLQNLNDKAIKALDDSIVGYIGKFGTSGNVVGKNAINEGGNVIAGDGVYFIKTSEVYYIGEGYENLFTENNLGRNSALTAEYIGDGICELTFTNSNAYRFLGISNSVLKIDTDFTLHWEIIDDTENRFEKAILLNPTYLVDVSSEIGEQKGSITGTVAALGESGNGAWLYFNKGATYAGYKAKIKVWFTETSNKVPFVEHSFIGGNLKTKDSYNEVDYTIISLDSTGAEQEYYIDAEGKINFHLANDGITKIESSKFMGVFKKLTDEVKTKQIEIINSGKYGLPAKMQGTVFPIEGMVRRADKYGIVTDAIEITDKTRDTYYVSDDGYYKVLDDSLIPKYAKIENSVITGTGIKDENNRVRLADDVTVPCIFEKIK